jgi:hypothetical protein
VKFLVINVLLDHVIVKFASHCTQSLPFQNKDSENAVELMKPSANLPEAFNSGILFSSLAQLDIFAVFTGFTNNLAPVLPVGVCDHCSASVASSTLPATVVLASGVPVLPKSLHAHDRYC